jgi:hypothetical protein
MVPKGKASPPPWRVLFLCCVVPRCTERGPLDHFEICADSNHEKIQRSTCYAARCSAAEDMDSLLGPVNLTWQWVPPQHAPAPVRMAQWCPFHLSTFLTLSPLQIITCNHSATTHLTLLSSLR